MEVIMKILQKKRTFLFHCIHGVWRSMTVFIKTAHHSVKRYNRRKSEDFLKQIIEAQLLEHKFLAIKQKQEYAKVVEKGMKEMYPTIKPCDEIKFSHRRTLQSYLRDFSIHEESVRPVH
jgi:hypothetical protein